MNKQWLSPLDHFTQLPEMVMNNHPIYYHSASNTTVQSHTVRIYQREYTSAIDIFQWRFRTEYPIVKVLNAHLVREVRNGTQINVLIEKIDDLLGQLSSLSLLQALYILKTSLMGAEKLVEKFGFFDLSNKMIGISRNKQCKVWINENFTSFTKMRQTINEKIMIDKLFRIVEQNTEPDSLSRSFFSRASQECSTFMKSQNFINQFAFQEQLVIPPLFLEKDRRRSCDPYTLLRFQEKGPQYHSFIQNCNDMSQTRIPVSTAYYRTERKIIETGSKQSQLKTSMTRTGSKTPTHISFTYRNKDSSIIKSPYSKYCILRLKQSEQTKANSTENRRQRLLWESHSQPFLRATPTCSKDSIISLALDTGALLRKSDVNKRMSIMSTMSLQIKSETIVELPQSASEISSRQKEDEVQHCQEIIHKLFHENFQKNEWKKTVSQLFSSDKNLKESMSYGEQEKVYLRDLDLKQLSKFGRFISTSVLERDEDQESEYCQEFRGFAV